MMEYLDKKIDEDGAFGTVDVQVASVGDFNGSNQKGEPIPEHLTPEALNSLAERVNGSGEEILVDVDHRSTKPGTERDTKAAGWLSQFYTNVKGLFAKLKLTKHGRELVDSREYRHLSPVFSLNQDGTPAKLHSCAFTNTPALEMEPILNSKPEEKEMSKEEIIELIKETVMALNAKPEEKKEEPKEEPKTEEVKEEPKEEKTEEAPKEEPKTEEVKEKPAEEKQAGEIKVELPKEELKEEREVIKEEALNSVPTIGLAVGGADESWRKLHGEDFWKWCAAHNLH